MERSKLRAEWVELVGGQSAQLGPIDSKRKDGRGHRNQSGINDASRQLDVPRATLQRDIRIASLCEEAQEAAVEHGLDDNQSALLII